MSKVARHIAVVTGTRAEFGLLAPLIRTLQQRGDVEVSVIACAAHLSPAHGLTVQEIEESGLAIAAKVDMLLASQTREGAAKSLGVGVLSFAECFSRLNPDIVVILGDRFEILAAASVLSILGIPIAHIHGGEITEGAFDESIRHAVTKMSHLHFTATRQFADRVIQLGEEPSRVFSVGALGVENIRRVAILSREELKTELQFDFGDEYFLVTYHPVTNAQDLGFAGLQGMLAALGRALENSAALKCIITLPNADPGNLRLVYELKQFAQKYSSDVWIGHSLGTERYLSAIQHACAIIGNSSSGIIEAPSLGVPTINIGGRQSGRPQATSVIQCAGEQDDIWRAIQTARSPEFKVRARSAMNPYQGSDTSRNIADVLATYDLEKLQSKRFYDLPKGLA